mmetsp:Transcript_80175/g.214738  ORF Transcript_80175/g.214738 Transcript_80175/m.214738 type:complete len:82 (-) Transcript_80175:525-770(-)
MLNSQIQYICRQNLNVLSSSRVIEFSSFFSNFMSTPNHLGFFASLPASKYLCAGSSAVGSGLAGEATLAIPTIAGVLQLLW